MVCVVTGATSGIGRATAAALARLGAQVVLVGATVAAVRRRPRSWPLRGGHDAAA